MLLNLYQICRDKISPLSWFQFKDKGTILSGNLAIHERALISLEGPVVLCKPPAFVKGVKVVFPSLLEWVIEVHCIVPLILWHVLPVLDVIVTSIPWHVLTSIKASIPVIFGLV